MMLQYNFERHVVIREAVRTIRRLLQLKLTVDINRYLIDKNAIGYREFEAEIGGGAPEIYGTGVLATPEKLELYSSYFEDQFLLDEVPLAAHETGEHIGSFPLDAAAAAYAFTQLEVFGNDVARLVDEERLGDASWHQRVKDNRQRGTDDEPRSIQPLEAARAGFGRYLDLDASQVPPVAVERLVAIKATRNAFAHGDSIHIGFSFDDFLENVIGVIRHIVFLKTGLDRISVYPFEDHYETFEPQTDAEIF